MVGIADMLYVVTNRRITNMMEGTLYIIEFADEDGDGTGEWLKNEKGAKTLYEYDAYKYHTLKQARAKVSRMKYYAKVWKFRYFIRPPENLADEAQTDGVRYGGVDSSLLQR